MSQMMALFKFPLYFPTIGNLRARRALGRLDGFVQAMIERQLGISAGDEAGDLLSLLKPLLYANNSNGAGEKQVRDEVMTFLLAGHETTAATLAWACYAISKNPDVENRLHQELQAALSGRDPSPSDIPRLPYTKMVIDEVMRLYPPVWLIPRKAINDDGIGGYRIPADSEVLISIYSLHRHQVFWENPGQFDPERFTPARSAQREPCCYLPFGAGPRSCIGSRLGLMESLLVVAILARKFHLEPISSKSILPEASLTLHPRSAVLMRLFERP